jgi:hypothetical protein
VRADRLQRGRSEQRTGPGGGGSEKATAAQAHDASMPAGCRNTSRPNLRTPDGATAASDQRQVNAEVKNA